MRQLLIIFLLCLAISCSKDKSEPEIMICIGNQPSWLTEKVKSLSSCICETALLMGIYNGQQVIEQHIVDPGCDGFDIVYSYDGTVLLTSMDQAEFSKYKAEVTERREIWRCSKTGAH
jgi:hypothetical protein